MPDLASKLRMARFVMANPDKVAVQPTRQPARVVQRRPNLLRQREKGLVKLQSPVRGKPDRMCHHQAHPVMRKPPLQRVLQLEPETTRGHLVCLIDLSCLGSRMCLSRPTLWWTSMARSGTMRIGGMGCQPETPGISEIFPGTIANRTREICGPSLSVLATAEIIV